MANRVISSDLWNDRKWRKEITNIRARYMWLYLLTCSFSKASGIFYLPIDTVVFETKLDEDECWQYLNELQDHHLCLYSKDTEEIAIFNYPKYNIKNVGTPIADMVRRELAQVKNKKLIEAVAMSLCDYAQKLVGKQRDMVVNLVELYKERGIGIELPILNTNTYTNTNTDTDTDTDTDTEMLEKNWDNLIDDLDNV